MMNRFSWLAAALALVGCIPAQVPAQQRFFVEARGGAAVPAGDLAEAVEVGGAFGGGGAVRVHPRVAVRADFDALFMEGRPEQDVVLPGINLFHTVAGVEVLLVPGAGPEERFTLTGNLGAGTTGFEIESFVAPGGQTFSLRERYPTANGGVRLAYALGRRVGVVLAGQGYLTFADEEDTAILEPLGVEPFGNVLSVPITAGLRIGL
jgi:hypothetical protein